jgi:hypothetical protein
MAPSPDKVYPQWTDISMEEMVDRGMLVETRNTDGKVVYIQSDAFKKQGKKSLERIYRCKLLVPSSSSRLFSGTLTSSFLQLVGK